MIFFIYIQSTPQPAQMQHTQSTLPPLPSLVNNMHPQQQQQHQQAQLPQQPLKANISLLQQPPQTNMVQAQNALNNNDVNQAFSAQAMNHGLSLAGLLGRYVFLQKRSEMFEIHCNFCLRKCDFMTFFR